MSNNELLEVNDFLRRGADRSTLSQIILPFCSDTNEDISPVALLMGNINLKASLRRNGESVPFEKELERLESEISRLKISKGQIIDLSAEMKKLQIESDEIEVEIREEWTESDEIPKKKNVETFSSSSSKDYKLDEDEEDIDIDIEELLRIAELEEERENGTSKPKTKIQEMKKESSTITKTKNELLKLNLPKLNSTNPLIGEVIERTTTIKTVDDDSQPPKKSSRFSLRRQ